MKKRFWPVTILVIAIVANGTVPGISAEYTNYVSLFSFSGTNGDNPYGDLIEGRDGRLYGVAMAGGLTNSAFPQGSGTVFALKKDGTGFTVLHYFGDETNDGLGPAGGLIEDRQNGMLYGTTQYGGSYNGGTIFRLNPDGSDYGVIRSFTGDDTNGGDPRGELLEASDEGLYGTAASGGFVFRIEADGSNYTEVSSLSDDIGDIAASPVGSLIQGTNGTLYGAGSAGWMPWDGGEINTDGALFEVNTDGSALAVDSIAFFASIGFPPTQPNGPLLDGRDGYIYGTTVNGVTPQGGCAFRFSIGPIWNFTVLSPLSGTLGPLFQPVGGLIMGSDGLLYGTAGSQYPHDMEVGQTPTYGGIFSLDTGGTNFSVLKVFYSSADGATPQGRLLLASDNGMYGVTSGGGPGGYGTVFALYPDAHSWFTGINCCSNTFSFVAIGAAGAEYKLQSAQCLSSSVWETVSSNTASVTGGLSFTNIISTGSPCFFRLANSD